MREHYEPKWAFYVLVAFGMFATFLIGIVMGATRC